MQQDQDRLRIHTAMRPPVAAEEKAKEQPLNDAGQTAEPQTTSKRIKSVGKQRRSREPQPLTNGEKLIRNTAVSCALLLSVLALKNVDQPWSRKATEGVRQVVNMRIDWDDTLGKLSFVRALVPDTALVFLNLGSGMDMNRPVNGQVVHEFTAQQPWLEFRCPAREAVCAALSGTVEAVGQGAGNDWIIMIRGEEDTEAVYGYLSEAYVQVGQKVEAGELIGMTADEENSRFYFELQENGSPSDPSGRMK